MFTFGSNIRFFGGGNVLFNYENSSLSVRKLAFFTYINWRIVVKIFSYQRTDSTLKKYDIFVYVSALIK